MSALVLGRRPTLVALLTLLAGCAAPSAPPGEPVTIDLVEMFRVSDAGPRTTEISLTAPENPHQLLWGWSAPVTAPDGQPALQIERAQSALTFRAGSDPGPMVIAVDRVLERPSGPHRLPESVRMHVNGVFVGRLAPDRDLPEIRVPEDALKPGRNLLSFRVIKRPREDPARPTARAFYRRVEFRSPRPAAPEPRVATGEALTLPAGSRASFFLQPPLGARLRADVQEPGRLVIRTQTDGGDLQMALSRSVARGETLDVPLALDGGIARIEVAAETERVTLERPRIEGTRARTVESIASAPPFARANVLLYVIDTLRADALDWSSGPDGPSPNLARFAEHAIVFDRAVAQSSWTRPSIASVLTGLHPPSHGVLSLTDRLGPQARLLSETLRDAGYDTAAFVTNANVSPPFGFTRGFTTYRYLSEDPRSDSVYVPARVLHDTVLEWLDTPRSQPFFLWVHASDPHAPYRPSQEFRGRFVPATPPSTLDADNPLRRLRHHTTAPSADDLQYVHALYNAEVAQLDAELGRFFAALGERRLLDDTIVILLADHGEEFYDHERFEHGNSLYQELVHVPLLVRLPSGASGRNTILAQHVDVVPTVLSLLGLPVPAGMRGRALIASDGQPASTQDGEAFSTTWFGRTALSSLVVPPWKIIIPIRGDVAPQVFDLRADPAERHDLAPAHPVLIGYARQRMAELEAAGELIPREGPAALDAETRERLRQLGYVIE